MKSIKQFFYFFLIFILSCSGHQSNKIETIKKLSHSYIPDSRLEIFDITTDKDSLFVKTSDEAFYNDLLGKNFTHLSLSLLPRKSLKHQYGIVNLSACNMRSESRHGSTLITQAILGTPVKIYEKDGSWYRIQTPDHYIGWVDSYGIEPLSENKISRWSAAQKVIFTDFTGFVYSDQDCKEGVVSDIILGNILQLEQEHETAYAVSFPDNRRGFIKKSEAKLLKNYLDNINLTGESLVELSSYFMGIPYLWGGTSYKGLDCSGFVKTLYFMHGIILQRDASQQVLYGKAISTENNYANLEKGDLLFFGRKDRITHVGMYIGDSKYIHEAGRVKINSLNKNDKNFSEFRASSLQKVRRIIGHTDSEGITTIQSNNFYNF